MDLQVIVCLNLLISIISQASYGITESVIFTLISVNIIAFLDFIDLDVDIILFVYIQVRIGTFLALFGYAFSQTIFNASMLLLINSLILTLYQQMH